jgi:hypothetical protein
MRWHQRGLKALVTQIHIDERSGDQRRALAVDLLVRERR